MVTASTAAFIFFIPQMFQGRTWTLTSNTLLHIGGLFVLALVVILTSTKAAFVTIFLAGLVAIIIFGSKKRSVRLFKFTFISCFLVSVIFTGLPASQFLYNVSTGKTSFGMRPAQDGVQTRMEEVTRGWSMFEKSPYFGLGLLYKFLNGSSEGIEVEGYNSFKDPHNLFVSAAVIGGYPLFLLSILGYLFLIYGAFKGMNRVDPNQKVLGLFLLVHLPVFVIYHAHFSLGGMGDRIYWLVFGYLGISSSNSKIISL
jgi:O-antigen ligase